MNRYYRKGKYCKNVGKKGSDFMQIISGTIGNAVKLQELTTKWENKKKSGNVLSKKERNERANWTQEQRLLNDFKEQAAQNREASKKNEIHGKIMSGGTLTPEEEQYLQSKDPEALQRYRNMKAEKKAYEEKLRHCKTKDEVQKLKTETVGGYLASFKKIENNPNIPLSAKLAKAQEMLAKTRNIQQAEMKFMQTAAYASLPTEAEEAQERAEDTKEENVEVLQQIEENIEDQDVVEDSDKIIPELNQEVINDVETNNDNEESIQESDLEKEKKPESKTQISDIIGEVEDICRKYIPTELSNDRIENKRKAHSQDNSVGRVNIVL